MNVREFITRFGFEVDEKPLDRMEQQLEGIKHRLEFLAAAEVVRGLVELTERFSKFAEEIHVAAESAGITVEAFQKLAFAASQSTVSQDQLGMSMARLARHLYEARTGSEEAAKSFRLAGISPGQVAQFKTGQDVLLALADRFKNIQDPIKKQAIAMELLGRGSVNMVSFLSKGSDAIRGLGNEADKLGIVLSSDQVEALVRVEHAMQKLWGVVKGIGATFASELAPSLEDAIKEFLKFYQANREILQINLKDWVWNVTFAMGYIFGTVKYLTQAFLNLAKALHLEGSIGKVISAIGLYISTLFLLQKSFGVAKLASEAFQWGLGPLIKTLSVARWAFSELLLAISTATNAEWLFSAAAAVAEAPLILIATAIAAVVLAVQALWTVFSGGSLKDSWIGELISYVTSIEAVGKAIEWVSGLLGSAGEKLTGAFSSLFPANSVQNIQNVQSSNLIPRANNFSNAGSAASSSSQQSYDIISAPITIHIENGGGADPKDIGQKVKEGVREHFDRVHRETQRALRSQVAY